eukprot:GHVR01103387.1.p1 GENE.GHVR01103387.1~~GHVR01103387.1.p1  ORF type:complete len:302 (+),score=31.34 GHVR01103387.1:619-1524(+)
MAINRAQLAKELEPGLNALFGLEYKGYENQHAEIFDTENSDRAFEEEVMLSGFGSASVKPEGTSVNFDSATESFTARYSHETVGLAFQITEEAVEGNLYDKISTRYTKALARSMAHTKQVKAANVLNNGFSSSFTGGDGVELFSSAHPTSSGNQRNELAVASDLNETSLEQAMIDIAAFADDRGLKVAAKARKLIIPSALQFTAERLMKSSGRTGTSDNDINAISSMGMIPEGYAVNNYLTDTDAFFIKTDVPNGLKHFQRSPIATSMEGDFETGNMKYKARERYSFGFSDWRGMFASEGA